MRVTSGTASHFPGARDILLFGEAVAALLLASMAIAILPFRLVAWTMRLGRSIASNIAQDQDRLADEVVRAVLRASRRTPWRTVCFHEGLAVHWMLRRRGVPSRLHYGLSRVENFGAHVWVGLGERILIGGGQVPDFKCVTSFPPIDDDEG